MKLALFALSIPLLAQTAIVPQAPTSATVGVPFTVTLQYNRDPTVPITDFQWKPAVTNGTFTPAVIGPAANTAGKPVSCGPAACVAAAFNNQTTVAGGVLATFTITPTAVGPVMVTITAPVASDANGGSRQIVGGTVTVTATSAANPFDINGDGKVDAADWSIVQAQVIGANPCTTGDVSGPTGLPDGKCDVFDLRAIDNHQQ